MPIPRAIFHGTAITVLASLAIACNSIVGVEDVSLGCYVNSDIKQVASDFSTHLSHIQNGGALGSQLIFQLGTNARPFAELNVELYDNFGQHGILHARGTSQLTVVDARGTQCGICVGVEFNAISAPISQQFWAFEHGDLTLDVADNQRLAGSMHDLQLREVNWGDNVISDVKDGCVVAIRDIEFDVMYENAPLAR